MPFLKQLFNFYIHSSLHVSIAVMCLTKITLLEFSIDDNLIPLFVFFSTIISYNFIKYYDIIKIDILSKSKINKRKLELILLNGISVLFLIRLIFKLKWEAFLLLIPFALIILFYTLPFNSKVNNLRNTASLKLFLIAISWAGVAVLLPLVQYEIIINGKAWILFVQRFLFVIAITIPFDIRDFYFDNSELKTLPKTIGIQKSKRVGIIVLILFLILEFYHSSIFENSIWIISIVALLSIVLLLFSSKNQSKYYSSFWVESIPIFWFLLLYFPTL